jgi:hypothetical protein
MNVFYGLIEAGAQVGAITTAHYYSKNFVVVEGITDGGQKFSVTLTIEEEKKDAQELE